MKTLTKSEQLEVCRTCPGQNCQECADNQYVMAIQKNLRGLYNISYDPENTECWFGEAPCQACGDTLAGDRYSILATKTSEHCSLEVCVDCYGYLMT